MGGGGGGGGGGGTGNPLTDPTAMGLSRLFFQMQHQMVELFSCQFKGFEELRLVSNESRHKIDLYRTVSLTFTKLNPPFMHRGGDPFILCFMDFTNPAYAATTLSSLQGDLFSHFHPNWHIDFFSQLKLRFVYYSFTKCGPDHACSFTATVNGIPFTTADDNMTLKEAENKCAKIALDHISYDSGIFMYLLQEFNLLMGEASNIAGLGLGRMGGGGGGGTGMGFGGRLLMDALSGGGMSFDGRLPVDAWSGGGIGFDGRLPLHAMPRTSHETIPPLHMLPKLYIFCQFEGFEELRLMSKESRHEIDLSRTVSLTFTKLNPHFMHRGGDPFILCFMDFTNPAYAATTLSALQGYKINEHDGDSTCLRL
ncbi:hypothetical protein RHGRI_008247 [Rhododendron griersonianum]|uniref:DRBM domain-containing protein n=1 Tax=Rhododendron griersonianum TaxID=479676 RepID=A0AAV6KZV0_9ERIC|nr:hypothetical protein RHGRI_008247 [Rhododendron griersonianum]